MSLTLDGKHEIPFDWQPMNTAPRDGTVIEIRCSYGVAPHYNLYLWTNEREAIGPTRQKFTDANYGWVQADDPSMGVGGMGGIDSTLTWRPYHGQVKDYIDPTNGRQRTDKYWREAVAAKYGLPKDALEPRSWIQRLLGLK